MGIVINIFYVIFLVAITYFLVDALREKYNK